MDKIPGAIVIVWILMILAAIVFWVLVGWGIIELVQWITSGGLEAAIHG